MRTIQGITYADAERFAQDVGDALRGAASFEAAAQRFAERLVQRFDTIVLARVFATVQYHQLPPDERRFVSSTSPDVTLLPSATVLTLFGTSGVRPAWNDRRQSSAHRALPLLDRRTIEEAPMLSRLLNDLQFALDGEAGKPAKFVTRAFANANGLCHIPDAGTTVDDAGRKVIPDGAFVREHALRTVVAFGGPFVVGRVFVATILFTTETISKEAAMHLVRLSSAFKSATTGVVQHGSLFAPAE
ncbi:MAG: hypothetical protein NVSMB19_17220 [Vulcanimicrobiaceae bacterium]